MVRLGCVFGVCGMCVCVAEMVFREGFSMGWGEKGVFVFARGKVSSAIRLERGHCAVWYRWYLVQSKMMADVY